MSEVALSKLKIQKKISRLPESDLKAIDDFLSSLLRKSKLSSGKPVTLKGIWEQCGFSALDDTEKALRDLRREMNEQILKRNI